jgi:hypothetical protein
MLQKEKTPDKSSALTNQVILLDKMSNKLIELRDYIPCVTKLQ